MKIKRFFDAILLGINVVVAAVLLFSCVVPYISIKIFPFLSALSLGVPLLVIANTIFFVFWLLRIKKQALISLSVLVLSYMVLGSFFQFRFSEKTPEADDFSVMTLNTRVLNKYLWIKDATIGQQIVDFVATKNPDVVCFQEFDKVYRNAFKSYPYSYIDLVPNAKRTVQAIYSKYPIIGKDVVPFPNTFNSAIYVDIATPKDTLRIYNVHMESLKISPSTIAFSQEESGKLYTRMSNSFVKQQEQAEIMAEHRLSSPYKTVICGDFNNTQFSSVYKTIKGDMVDSFEAAGIGYGRTYDFPYFPMRIDFILSDKEMPVKTHHNFSVKLSDHFPVQAYLEP